MKRILILFAVLFGLFSIWLSIRVKLVERLIIAVNDPPHGKNWKNEVEKQSRMYSKSKDIIFLGDSHIEQCEWQEIFPEYSVGNRGVGGETSGALLIRLDAAVKKETKSVVLQIGVNDILSGLKPKDVDRNYKEIIRNLKIKGCQVLVTIPFLTRYYPDKNIEIEKLNNLLKTSLRKEKVDYLDLNPTIAPKGELLTKFTSDGVHLNTDGYKVWIDSIKSDLDLK